MSKSILILVYSLAPKRGVGGRRWRKFAHNLADKGHKVFIMGAFDPLNEYIEHPNLKYITFKSAYPKILTKTPKNVWQKIIYRGAKYKQSFISKGIIYDPASRNEKEIVSAATDIISTYNIRNLIVSGAPFSLLHYGVLIKKLCPSINLICDMRDPWTWGQGYGIPHLNGKKKKYEKAKESEVMINSDAVTVASIDLEFAINKHYPEFRHKTFTLLNGIEFSENCTKDSIKNDTKTIRILHIGTVTDQVEKYWKPFLQFISEINISINLVFVGCTNTAIKQFVRENRLANIEFKPRVAEKELKKYFEQANYLAMFKKDGFENTFPTKFFDYIKSGKLILAFTKDGLVSKEIEQNGLGKVFDEKFDKKRLLDYIIHNDKNSANPIYGRQQFAIEVLTAKLAGLLKV